MRNTDSRLGGRLAGGHPLLGAHLIGVAAAIGLSLWLIGSLGCGQNEPRHQGGKDGSTPRDQKPGADAPPFPDLGPGKQLEPGIVVHEVWLRRGGSGRLWIYLPAKPAPTPLPCVLIAPAGSTGFLGMDLGDGDRAEHLPYVRDGFAVVAYAIDGQVDNLRQASNQQIVEGTRAFMKVDAGLVNARNALDYLAAKVPAIDSQRIYTAGHSSAASTSLYVAEKEPRIKGCIAFAPATDWSKRLDRRLVQFLSANLTGVEDFVRNTSPITHAASLRCPLFLFHAEDDANVPISQSATFAAEVKKTNASVTFVRAARGNHYDSMIKEGIPQAIRWLKETGGK